ncbi:hypothetical protein AAF712_014421 [Marasmius tenuissimus]|uniref:F-box domain-containing protein n=1 Tax=Marasmius tenuissimus TaxID=585030 RepID=A0ABR2ZC47_9AGAR
MPSAAVLSSVSSHWRDLTISFPKLWSHLRFEIGGKTGVERYDNEERQRCFRETNYHLDRAGKAPLTLAFLEVDIRDGVDLMPFDLALDALCRRVGQWANIEFDLGRFFLEANASTLRMIRGNLVNLQSYCSREGGIDHRWATDFLGTCPSLQNVSLREWGRSRSFSLLPTLLPWNQLRSLSLATPSSPYSVFEMLGWCPNLESLTFWTYESDPTWPQVRVEPASWSVHSLSIIIVDGYDTMIFQDFLQYVTLPHLASLDMNTLSITNEPTLSTKREKCLHDLIRRSSRSITSLSPHHCPFTGEQAVDLLRLLPGLTYLYIDENMPVETVSTSNISIIYHEHLFDHLSVDPSSTTRPFLPRLTNLKIVVGSKAFPDKAFVKAIRSRWILDPELSVRVGVDCIRSVEVSFNDYPANVPDSLLRLEKLKKLGLGVSIPECRTSSS